MIILNVLALMAMMFVLGYYLGKGKIEITKKLDKETSQKIAEEQMAALKKQEEAYENFNKLTDQIGGEF